MKLTVYGSCSQCNSLCHPGCKIVVANCCFQVLSNILENRKYQPKFSSIHPNQKTLFWWILCIQSKNAYTSKALVYSSEVGDQCVFKAVFSHFPSKIRKTKKSKGLFKAKPINAHSIMLTERAIKKETNN